MQPETAPTYRSWAIAAIQLAGRDRPDADGSGRIPFACPPR